MTEQENSDRVCRCLMAASCLILHISDRPSVWPPISVLVHASQLPVPSRYVDVRRLLLATMPRLIVERANPIHVPVPVPVHAASILVVFCSLLFPSSSLPPHVVVAVVLVRIDNLLVLPKHRHLPFLLVVCHRQCYRRSHCIPFDSYVNVSKVSPTTSLL